MPGGIVCVKRYFKGKKRPQIATELTERELAAIGLVTVQWAYLEHKILELTEEIAAATGSISVEEASRFSFDRRLEALTKFLKSPNITNEEARQGLLKVLHRIHRLKNDRHKITHGVWDWNYHNPTTPIASSKKRKHEFEEPFDFEKLIKLAERIAEVNYELTFLAGYSDENSPETYISRLGAALMRGDTDLLESMVGVNKTLIGLSRRSSSSEP
jgi:hypothetical protein